MTIAIKTAVVLSIVCSAGSMPARCVETMSRVMQKRDQGRNVLLEHPGVKLLPGPAEPVRRRRLLRWPHR